MSTTIGVDIGFNTVKIVSLQGRDKRWRLEGMAISDCPADSWKPDALHNVDEIAKVIGQAMRTAKPHSISGKKAMVALPESVIFSGTFSVPHLPASELKQALPLQIADRLSVEIDEYYFDYEEINSQCSPVSTETLAEHKETTAEIDKEKAEPSKLPDSPKDVGQPAITVFAIAAKKTLIQSVQELCKKANLDLAGIDIKPGAIVRSIIPSGDRKIRLILDLGVGGTGASIAEGRELRVTSIIPWGINAIGEHIDGPVDDLRSKAAPVFDELVHITRFFENRICPGVKIEELVISGSGANIPNVVEEFQKETGLPTRLSDPFSQIDTSHFPVPKNLVHTFSDAIGLAMRVL